MASEARGDGGCAGAGAGAGPKQENGDDNTNHKASESLKGGAARTTAPNGSTGTLGKRKQKQPTFFSSSLLYPHLLPPSSSSSHNKHRNKAPFKPLPLPFPFFGPQFRRGRPARPWRCEEEAENHATPLLTRPFPASTSSSSAGQTSEPT